MIFRRSSSDLGDHQINSEFKLPGNNVNREGDGSVVGSADSDSNGFAYLVPGWSAPGNIHALTTTRNGGYSESGTSSLNLGENTSDSIDLVERNRNFLRKALALDNEPVWLKQVHGTELLSLPSQLNSPIADGAFTKISGQICAILTADCLPLFMCDRFGEQVALLHVGWRGLAAGMVEKGVGLFEALPVDLMAWAGPAISQSSFEIGTEVREQLGGSKDHYRVSQRKGRCYADLYSLVRDRLNAVGVSEYGWDAHCTFQDEESFYSYRRDPDCGRMASLIWNSENN